MSDQRTSSGGTATSTSVGMWNDSPEIQDLRDGK